MSSIKRLDPAGLIWSLPGLNWKDGQESFHTQVNESERQILMPAMTKCFANKRILNLSGGADKLVPYTFSKPFVSWLKTVSGKGGFFEGGGCIVEDIVFEGVGHEVPGGMVTEMVRFVRESLEDEKVLVQAGDPNAGAGRSSKI
jgi:hypothetical protein